jgi:hypothetical protein
MFFGSGSVSGKRVIRPLRIGNPILAARSIALTGPACYIPRHSSLNFMILRVIESQARVLGSQHPAAESSRGSAFLGSRKKGALP